MLNSGYAIVFTAPGVMNIHIAAVLVPARNTSLCVCVTSTYLLVIRNKFLSSKLGMRFQKPRGEGQACGSILTQTQNFIYHCFGASLAFIRKRRGICDIHVHTEVRHSSPQEGL